MENDITPEILKSLLANKEMKHKDLEPILNLENPKISAMMNGKRKISASEQKLLKLYFYGIMPFDLIRPQGELSDHLTFTGDEWKVITILATREGFNTTQEWITSQIRGYLAYCETKHSELTTPVYFDSENAYPFEILTSLAAGSGTNSDNVDIIDINKQYPPSYKGAYIQGESMESDTGLSIPDGSIAVLDTDWEGKPFPVKNKIFAFATDEGDKIKKFVRRKVDGKTQLFLDSLNPDHKPIPYEENMIPQGQFIEVLEQ